MSWFERVRRTAWLRKQVDRCVREGDGAARGGRGAAVVLNGRPRSQCPYQTGNHR